MISYEGEGGINKMDTTQYMDVFIDESTEHLEVLSNELLALEKDPHDKSIIDEIFRAAHTIKGMSATMGYEDISHLTHALENVLDDIRYETLSVETHIVDVLFVAVNHLNEMIDDISSGGDGKRNIQSVAQQLEQIKNGTYNEQTKEPVQNEKVEAYEGTSLDEFERAILNESSDRGFNNYNMTIHLIDDCILKGARVFMVFEVLEQLGEIIKTEPPVSELEQENFESSFSVILVSKSSQEEIAQKVNKVSEIKQVDIQLFSVDQYTEEKPQQTKETEVQSDNKAEANSPQRQVSGRKTIRVNIDRLDVLMNLFEELVIDKGRLEQIALDIQHHDLQETVERMSRVSGDLQNVILNMRMVPINQVFNRFPSMIRQLARDLQKEIDIEVIGEDTELDRTVIDEIGDPLVHLIRNAADHGIETPEQRRAQGKSSHGTIILKAYHSGNYVFIDIMDNGAGIDKEKVLQKAISNSVISEEQSTTLTDSQVYELIMASGFSTTDVVSDVSGRGVGLDVVKNTIETLGGSITIQSKMGEGSTFSIQLPLTLSIISVLLVELQTEKYAIPLSSIIETVIVHKDQVLHAHNKKVIDFRNKVVPLAFLNDIFSVPFTKTSTDYLSIVIVKRGDKITGLVVDSFIGQQEVVLKSLGQFLTNIPAISGATILGDGEVALIIDSNALIK